MNFLILNSGSSSLKFQLIGMPEEAVHLKGIFDGIGQNECALRIESGTEKIEKNISVQDHAQALTILLDHLGKSSSRAVKIEAVGHRVVHGGEKYRAACLVTDSVLKDIVSLSDLAPLHNPANVAGIQSSQKFLPNVPNIAVFDTAFHQTLPKKAYLYGLPYELYEKFGIRKYGFHGISHQYVSREATKILKENIKDFKILSCHLGAGASICAISEGKSVEISMGFTPLEGLMMGTRSGSFDPEIILYLLRKGYSVGEVEEMIQKKGGLKGISEQSQDVRELREDELSGNSKSELAFEMFVYRIQRFIGSYSAVLGGLEILIFTGGVGEKAYYIRRRICEKFRYMGIHLDHRENRSNKTIISASDSQVTVMVIPTNEELQIAREMSDFL
ncbi:MAG: acetate kinase [Elusimicrobia bacterium]|nr:acetate kinase [Elusimicrobiota bacterium]